MNINMNLDPKELNVVFEIALKQALINNIPLNLNIDLKKMETPVKLTPPTKATITIGKCEECGCIQAVNMKADGSIPPCYVCRGTIEGTFRTVEADCKCGDHLFVDVIGDNISYVTCRTCGKRHALRLNTDTNKWEVK